MLIGRRDQWRTATPPDEERSYWGVAARDGNVYAAHPGGVDRLDGDALISLEIESATDLEFAVLRDGPDGIWSFAGQTMGLITDSEWQTIEPR